MSVTQHRPDGTPGSPYGDFSGKAGAPAGTKPYTGTVTQHGAHGGIAMPYGSFAGKAAPAVVQPARGGSYAPAPRRRPGPAQVWIDDQLVVALLMALMQETETQ